MSSEDSGDHSLSVPAVSDGGASARRRASDARPMCGFGGSFLTGGINTRTCWASPSNARCVHLFDIICIALRIMRDPAKFKSSGWYARHAPYGSDIPCLKFEYPSVYNPQLASWSGYSVTTSRSLGIGLRNCWTWTRRMFPRTAADTRHVYMRLS